MRKFTNAILFLFIFTACNIFAQSAEEQKAWMDYMTPGSVHEMLAQSNGTWIGENTFWMAPGAPPITTTSEASNSMIMGGRYQQGLHVGDMMGMPFEGMSLIGYDNAKKQIQSIWIDNFGTGMMHLTGTWDESSQTVTMTGTSVDPSTGKDVKVREIFSVLSPTSQLLEMFMEKDGTEFKTMEIKYTKK